MPQFTGLAVCDTWAAAGGTPQREIARHALASCRGQFTVENPDQNRLTFGVRRNWAGLSAITARSVMRLTKSDGSFDEWRNSTLDIAVLGTGIKAFEALPPIYMLAECGEYYTTGAGGARDYSYALTGATPSQALTTLVLGTPDIPAFVTIAVDAAIDAVLIDVESTDEGKTPLAIAYQVRDAVRAKGVPCELDFVRVGTTGYALQLVTQIGANAPIPEFAVGKNVIDYLLKYNCTQQTTRVRTKGPVDATGLAARLSRARYAVAAVNGGTRRVQLADEAGGAGPIKFDEQYVGWAAFRERTGRTFPILHSYAATQEIELADVSTMAVHSVTAPEWISFRESETTTGTRRLGATDITASRVHEITGVAGAVLSVREYSAGADTFDADGRFIDWRTERATLVLATTGSCTAVAERLDCASVAGVAAGDVVLIGMNAAHPYTQQIAVCTVDSVDAVNKYLFLSRRYGTGTLLGTSGTAWQARIYRPVATTHWITNSAAAANTVTVDAPGTAASTDVLLRIYQECQGVLPTWVESPADVAAYGVKYGVLGVAEGGECDLTPNPVMRSWPGSPSAPADGWAWSGTGGAMIARSTFTLQGGYSAYCVFLSSATAGVLTTPPAFVHPAIGSDLASVRVRLFITDFPAGEEWDPTYTYICPVRSSISVTCYKRTPGGVLTQLGTPAVLNCPWTGAKDGVTLNAWTEATLPGLDLSMLVDETLVVKISAAWGGSVPGGSIKAYVDGVQITQTPTPPREYPALLIEYAEGNRHVQQANLELATWAAPPTECTVKLVDLERVDPVRYSADQVTPGGLARLFNPAEGVDLTVRCPAINVNYLNEADTDVTLAMLPTRFTGATTQGGGGGGSTAPAPAVATVGVNRWGQILDKPEAFPPSAHTHAPDDLVGVRTSDYEARGDGAGLHVGLVHLDANAEEIVAMDGGAVTMFFVFPIGHITRLQILGNDGNGNVFRDEITTEGFVPPFSLPEITQNNLLGTPGLRTYSIVTNAVYIAIAGGPPNPIRYFRLRFFVTHF